MSTLALTKPSRTTPVSNAVIGMVLLVITEIMFFAGLISAYLVNRAGAPSWPPANQPRLPIEITGVNTLILLLSGVFFWLLIRHYPSKGDKARIWLLLSMITGLIFVGIQGYEWIRLIGYGLTTTSSVYGAFFYSVIGMHGFHVLIGLGFLLYLLFRLKPGSDREKGLNRIQAVGIFWFFVVAIWPVLYYMVYLF